MSETLETPLAYRPEQALAVFPIGRTLLFNKIRSGEIESFTVGRARFIPRKALLDFMQERIAETKKAEGRL